MDWDRAERAEMLLQAVERWMVKHNVREDGEAIYQSDSANLSLPELAEELISHVKVEDLDYVEDEE